MPLYDYRCEDCGDFSALRPMSQSSVPTDCPNCGRASLRVLAASAQADLQSASVARARDASAVRAQASRIAGRFASSHGAGCGCCARPGRFRRG